jgi:hypothetical protein
MLGVALVVWLVATSDMVQIAVAITAVAFLLALAYLRWATWLTARRDRLALDRPSDGER